MAAISTTHIQVRYRETDQMAVAWHGNYIEWFEVARLDWWREQGFSYRALEERGFLLPVLKVACEYHRASHFDDILAVTVSLKEYNGFRLAFDYQVTRPQDETPIASGLTEHVFTDRTLQPVRIERKLPDVHTVLQIATA